jgi:hypothetical protein
MKTLDLKTEARSWFDAETEQDYERADAIAEGLAAHGWEIGLDESGEDNAACFCVMSGDINGHSYTAFGKSELTT